MAATTAKPTFAEMEWLIADIDENGIATSEKEAQGRPVPSFPASP